jgi:hypothetical protein
VTLDAMGARHTANEQQSVDRIGTHHSPVRSFATVGL